MKRIRHNQAGFEAVMVIVVVLFIAVIGFAGYKVLHMNQSATEQTSASSKVVVPDKIETKADLEQTDKSLDQSGKELDNSLNETSLDTDLELLL